MNGERAAERIGVFGGTFNPIHVGHLRAAEEVTEALGLSTMLFVPSAEPPHKRASSETIAPAADRLEWVRLAVADNPSFAVDPIEVERTGPSYLVDTLRELGARHGRERLVFVLGRDAFSEMDTWREPDVLLTLADFAVMSRPPLGAASLGEWIPDALAGELVPAADGRSATHKRAGTRIELLEITALDVSASEIRRRLQEGRSVRYLLPDRVRDAIVSCGAYAARDRAPESMRGMTEERVQRARRIAEAVLEKKAEDVVALDVRDVTSFADTLVVATGTSDRHVRTIADAVTESQKARGEQPLGIEGYEDARWVLIDLADVVVHVFQREVREHYDLERLWSDAARLEMELAG